MRNQSNETLDVKMIKPSFLSRKAFKSRRNKHEVNTVSQKAAGGRDSPGTSVICFQESVSICSQKTKILSSAATAEIVYDRDAAGGRALQSINLAQMNNIVGERNVAHWRSPEPSIRLQWRKKSPYQWRQQHLLSREKKRGGKRSLIPAGFGVALRNNMICRIRGKKPVSIRLTSSRGFIEPSEPRGLMVRDWKRERETDGDFYLYPRGN